PPLPPSLTRPPWPCRASRAYEPIWAAGHPGRCGLATPSSSPGESPGTPAVSRPPGHLAQRACYALDGPGKRARVVPLGMGPTMNAWTDAPMDAVANDAWVGTSSGIAIVCAPVGSSSSRITCEVLVGSGGTNEVAHQAVTVTCCS